MKKNVFLTILALVAVMATSAVAHAATTNVGISVGRGDSDSMAYSLRVLQSYEPWFSTEAAELTPTMELGGHAWVDDSRHVDTVWGASLAPGLRFTLFTTSSFQPFLAGSIGGALNSENSMDELDFGSNALIKTKGSIGVEIGESHQHRIQGDYENYSTWGITNKNDGYNTYGISYGYSF